MRVPGRTNLLDSKCTASCRQQFSIIIGWFLKPSPQPNNKGFEGLMAVKFNSIKASNKGKNEHPKSERNTFMYTEMISVILKNTRYLKIEMIKPTVVLRFQQCINCSYPAQTLHTVSNSPHLNYTHATDSHLRLCAAIFSCWPLSRWGFAHFHCWIPLAFPSTPLRWNRSHHSPTFLSLSVIVSPVLFYSLRSCFLQTKSLFTDLTARGKEEKTWRITWIC